MPDIVSVPYTSTDHAPFLSGITREIPLPSISSTDLITGVSPCGESIIELIAEIWNGLVVMFTVMFSTSISPFQSNSLPVQFSVTFPLISIDMPNKISSAKNTLIVPDSPRKPTGTTILALEPRFNSGGAVAFMWPETTNSPPS